MIVLVVCYNLGIARLEEMISAVRMRHDWWVIIPHRWQKKSRRKACRDQITYTNILWFFYLGLTGCWVRKLRIKQGLRKQVRLVLRKRSICGILVWYGELQLHEVVVLVDCDNNHSSLRLGHYLVTFRYNVFLNVGQLFATNRKWIVIQKLSDKFQDE